MLMANDMFECSSFLFDFAKTISMPKFPGGNTSIRRVFCLFNITTAFISKFEIILSAIAVNRNQNPKQKQFILSRWTIMRQYLLNRCRNGQLCLLKLSSAE